MSQSRNCTRCNGEEFLMTTESGVVIEWENKDSGARNTWFCPSCDWGTPSRTQRRLAS